MTALTTSSKVTPLVSARRRINPMASVTLQCAWMDTIPDASPIRTRFANALSPMT